MKLLIFLFILSLTTFAGADTVTKWIDKEGKVHYGNTSPPKDIKNSQTIKIENTYDQQSYDEGLERHKETEQFASQLEKERQNEDARRKQEEEDEKNAKLPARRARGVAVPNPVVRSLPLPNRPSRPVNRPVQQPAE